jgi:hypothetical protein
MEGMVFFDSRNQGSCTSFPSEARNTLSLAKMSFRYSERSDTTTGLHLASESPGFESVHLIGHAGFLIPRRRWYHHIPTLVTSEILQAH